MNLIELLGWYLWCVFAVGLILRIRLYKSLVGVVWLFPGRWPHLFELVKKHRRVFVTWKTLLPGFAALTLSIAHMCAFRLLWPEAELTVAQLAQSTSGMLAALLFGCAMVTFDLYSALRVSKWDREAVQKQFDQAEYWLKSWSAPVVRILSLGFINPRKLVGVEIRKALENASYQINSSLWWMSLQVALRIAFGASLWITWADRIYQGV